MLITAAMIHWTRQIKEVLSAQEALETAESSGPLEEIDFWNNRCIDLSGTYFIIDNIKFFLYDPFYRLKAMDKRY